MGSFTEWKWKLISREEKEREEKKKEIQQVRNRNWYYPTSDFLIENDLQKIKSSDTNLFTKLNMMKDHLSSLLSMPENNDMVTTLFNIYSKSYPQTLKKKYLETKGIFNLLPSNLMIKTCSFLEKKEMIRTVRLTNKSWYSISKTNCIYLSSSFPSSFSAYNYLDANILSLIYQFAFSYKELISKGKRISKYWSKIAMHPLSWKYTACMNLNYVPVSRLSDLQYLSILAEKESFSYLCPFLSSFGCNLKKLSLLSGCIIEKKYLDTLKCCTRLESLYLSSVSSHLNNRNSKFSVDNNLLNILEYLPHLVRLHLVSCKKVSWNISILENPNITNSLFSLVPLLTELELNTSPALVDFTLSPSTSSALLFLQPLSYLKKLTLANTTLTFYKSSSIYLPNCLEELYVSNLGIQRIENKEEIEEKGQVYLFKSTSSLELTTLSISNMEKWEILLDWKYYSSLQSLFVTSLTRSQLLDCAKYCSNLSIFHVEESLPPLNKETDYPLLRSFLGYELDDFQCSPSKESTEILKDFGFVFVE